MPVMIDLFPKFLAIIFRNKRMFAFAFISAVGVAFSMSVVLTNLGLMQGYDYLFKKGLQQSSADLEGHYIRGFFTQDDEIRQILTPSEVNSISSVTFLIQSEAFVIKQDLSRGVLIRGVDSQSYARTTGTEIGELEDKVVIGSALAKDLALQVGDHIVLAFARGGHLDSSQPRMRSYEIGRIVSHGVHHKDSRLIYMDYEKLFSLVSKSKLGSRKRYNLFLVRLVDDFRGDFTQTEELRDRIVQSLDFGFQVKTFWQDFSTLIEAVEVEKYTISLVLQVIVLIALFNVVALLFYIFDKKSPEFFLLRALGITMRTLQAFWVAWACLLWLVSCLLTLGMIIIFNKTIQFVSAKFLPAQVYNLSHLELVIFPVDYLAVFAMSLLWICICVYIVIRQMKKKSILSGLREEFR